MNGSVRVQCQKRSKVIIDVKDQYCCIQLCKVSRSIQYLGQKYLRLFQLIKVLNNHSTIINHVMISDAFRFERSRIPSLSRYLTKRPLHPSSYTAIESIYTTKIYCQSIKSTTWTTLIQVLLALLYWSVSRADKVILFKTVSYKSYI